MTTPESRQAPLGQLLLQAFQWFDRGLLAALDARSFGAQTLAQSLVFAHLDTGGTRSTELARRIGVSRQAVHKTVGELEVRGYVTLEPDPDNRSAKLVTLSARGEQTMAAALEAFAALEAELARRLGTVRVRALRSTLEDDWGPASSG